MYMNAFNVGKFAKLSWINIIGFYSKKIYM